jgi:acyl carrier protein
MTNPTHDRIRDFLSRHFRSHYLQADEDIIALGVMNSLLAMQLVTFVEVEFGIRVDDNDLDLDNFRSIQAIADFVARKSHVA